MSSSNPQETIRLPEPRYDGSVSVEHALLTRRSVRNYKNTPITLTEIAQLLWAAQGITTPRGYRTAPSAGALYPLETYVVAGNVNDLATGIYKYRYHDHALLRTVVGDKRTELSNAALSQGSIARAPAVLLFCAVYGRITGKYGNRGIQYTFMEIGHAAQNVCLQAIALDLVTVVIGAFRDHEVKLIANLAADEEPTYFIPVGRR
ncbi:MAG: SagB/ThcOx family dehydrogenase [Desulfobacteraceae bacterium]|jgi:SagB-type dehydrogenase family enzyme